MHLRCVVCAAVQPVNVADEADDDPRTQSIRRGFRAEHLTSCGLRTVSLLLHAVDAIVVDPELWNTYLDQSGRPADVAISKDGFFTRTIHRDGAALHVRVCEDCWQNIPRYVDFPAGLVSPESDGAGGAVPKWRASTVETDNADRAGAIEHLWKAVCLPCYHAAFSRVYPGAVSTPMRADVVGDGSPIEPPPPVSDESIGRVSLSHWSREAAV